MNISTLLFRKSVFYFALFFLFTIWAFWPTYYSNPVSGISTHIQVHGIFMTSWCLLLILQASLIRFKKHSLHRILGKVSYLLVPLVILSGINVAHFSIIQNLDLPSDFFYSNFGHMFNSIVVFAIIYGLAIKYRKDSAIHARYMICTLFPAFTPVFSRLIYNHFDFILPMLPTLNGIPLVQLIGFGIADVILLTLCALDWRKRKQWNGFPIALLIMLAYHISDFTFYRIEIWRKFVDWIISLPLS